MVGEFKLVKPNGDFSFRSTREEKANDTCLPSRRVAGFTLHKVPEESFWFTRNKSHLKVMKTTANLNHGHTLNGGT